MKCIALFTALMSACCSHITSGTSDAGSEQAKGEMSAFGGEVAFVEDTKADGILLAFENAEGSVIVAIPKYAPAMFFRKQEEGLVPLSASRKSDDDHCFISQNHGELGILIEVTYCKGAPVVLVKAVGFSQMVAGHFTSTAPKTVPQKGWTL